MISSLNELPDHFLISFLGVRPRGAFNGNLSVGTQSIGSNLTITNFIKLRVTPGIQTFIFFCGSDSGSNFFFRFGFRLYNFGSGYDYDSCKLPNQSEKIHWSINNFSMLERNRASIFGYFYILVIRTFPLLIRLATMF